VWPQTSPGKHFQPESACWGHFPGIPRQDMSEFMKTVSNLGQNFRAWLSAIAGREAFAVLKKPDGLPSRRVREDSPGT